MHLSPNVNNIVLSVLPTIVLFQMLMVHLRNTQAFELDEPRTNLGLSLLTSQKPYLTKYNFRKLRTSTARIVFRTVYQRQCYWWQCRISEWHCCRWLEWRPSRCSKTVSLFISIRKNRQVSKILTNVKHNITIHRLSSPFRFSRYFIRDTIFNNREQKSNRLTELMYPYKYIFDLRNNQN